MVRCDYGGCGVLVVNSGGEEAVEAWRALFAEHAPGLEVRWIEDPAVDPAAVRYAFVWAPKPGVLAGMKGLRLILSSGAGVDHITADPDWPRHVGIVRMGGAETEQRMGEYVCLGALSLLRDMPRMVAQQREGRWESFEVRTAREVRVGLMGLGNLGVAAARMLGGLGFAVAGWSRSRKEVAGVACFAGAGERDAFLARSDILVNLLPDTAETKGAIRAETLALLPRGAGLVNAGRGPQVVLDDVLAALDAGQLSGAFLDVFDPEPLAAGHRAWSHPRVIVTPHVASMASRPARARYVAGAIAAFERGERLANLYDAERGY